jgi:hypothetical protein
MTSNQTLLAIGAKPRLSQKVNVGCGRFMKEIGSTLEDEFQRLWQELDDILCGSLMVGKRCEPWDHQDEESDHVWRHLTQPRFEAMLRDRLDMNLNPRAREVTERALSDCRKGRNSQPGQAG